MYVRKKKNKSGTISIQIIKKIGSKNKLVKTIGHSSKEHEIRILEEKAKQELIRLQGQSSLFANEKDSTILAFMDSITNQQIRTIGPELIFGKVYDFMGYGSIDSSLLRHLVISRLAFPLSKLKTIEYLQRYQGVSLNINSVYKFLDQLDDKLKDEIEKISYQNTLRNLGGKITIAFYDLTTLYFEASDEDDLRKTGFNKDGKHSNPQIFIGLLVGIEGYAIGYDVFKGDIYEGHTLIPTIEKLSRKFNLENPVIIADSGLLSNENIEKLRMNGYTFILGARLKNATKNIKSQILNTIWKDGKFIEIKNSATTDRLIVQFSDKRAKKDNHNRERGLKKLEKQITSNKLTKKNINNRGYNKYLKMTGEVMIEIDYEKFRDDKKWDGLKGYVTNSNLESQIIIENYKQLWNIEKAFRMSKTDLRIRPIYHRLESRIKSHLCISFVAYSIYKELERVLKIEKFHLSVEKAAELTHTMYQLEIILPQSLQKIKAQLKMTEDQQNLADIVNKNFWATQK
jgi:transposase